ncbi:MAG: flagellar biosynthesis regulator FlaF [Pseudomonadota bacterium]
MTPTSRAATAYGDPASFAKSPRQTEYLAFARITQALKRNADRKAVSDDESGGGADPAADHRRFAQLAEALHENLRLWTIVQRDVAVPENSLPEGLRAQLFYLAEFTREHTKKVLRGDAPTDPLIDINTAVMRGLRSEQEPERCPA